MKDIIDALNMRPKWQILFFGFILTALLGVIDYLTGDFSLTLFYILPVFIGAWFVNKWAGFSLSFIAGVTITVAEQMRPVTLFNPSALRIWNTTMEIGFLFIMNYLFCLLKKELDIEKALARTDHLTGALNRLSFMELAEYEINQSRRHQRPLTIAYIDLDNFKAVNDMFGHHDGDLLLCNVVRIMLEISRRTDLVARVGGDEFSIFYPQTNAMVASDLLVSLQVRLLDVMKDNNWPVTFSIGAVTYINPPVSAVAMLKEADARMYAVKQNGKNMISHATIDTHLPIYNGKEDDRPQYEGHNSLKQ